MIKTYFTLNDLVSEACGTWNSLLDAGVSHKVDNANYLPKMFSELLGVSLASTDPLANEIGNTLFCTYIAPRYKELYIGYLKGPVDEMAIYELYNTFLRNFASIYKRTYTKYKTLIETYEAEKTHLMDDIMSYSESKFNDTPQNIQGEYDWSTDDHLTNVSRNESGSQLMSKVNRIDEIERLLQDYYDRWSDAFRGMFFYD